MGKKFKLLEIAALVFSLLLSACGGGGGGGGGGTSSTHLVSIAVSPAAPSIAAGTTQQFKATGSYSDGTSQDITGSVAWMSSDTAIATIDAAGKAAAEKAGGPVLITATTGGVSGSASLTVTAAVLQTITVAPANASIAKGLSQQFTATGSFSDGTSQDISGSVVWESSDTGVATVSAGGLATAVAAGGPVSITAMSGSISGSANLAVTNAVLQTITVTQANSSIAAGQTQQFKATGAYSDGSSVDITGAVTWNSGDTGVATIDGSGKATAVKAGGPVLITAALGAISGTASLTVTNAVLQTISVTPASASVIVGLTQQFKATGNYSDSSSADITGQAVWASDNTGVATVTGGLASGVAPGSANITASVGGITSGNAALTVSAATLQSITISPSSGSIAAGQSLQFKAMGNYSNGSTADITSQVIWKSDNTGAATVAAGLATGIAKGSANITASAGGITSGNAALTVTDAVLQSISVSPVNNPSIAAGLTQQFSATGIYSNGTTSNLSSRATWTTGNTAVAGVNQTGLAMGVGPGQTQIIATSGSVTGSAWLTVTPAYLVSIAVQPSNPTVTVGNTQQFWAEGIYTDGTWTNLSPQVTWKSGNTSVATVNASGLATGKAAGTANIIATWNLNTSYWNEAPLTVAAAIPGVTWTVQSSPTTADLNSVSWNGVVYVAVGNSSTILTSVDGKTWWAQTSNDPYLNNLYDVTWTGSRFVAVGQSDTILTSPDGTSWTVAMQLAGNPDVIRNVAVVNNLDTGSAVAVGGLVWLSQYGDWSAEGSYGSYLNGVVAPDAYDSLAVGQGGIIVTGLIVDWGQWPTRQSSPTTQNLNSVAVGVTPLSTFYVAVGDNGTALWSTDETTWSTVQNSGLPAVSLRRVMWDGNKFFAVSAGGGIFTDDPLTGGSWTSQTSGTTKNLYGITMGSGGQYVAVGAGGTILTSP